MTKTYMKSPLSDEKTFLREILDFVVEALPTFGGRNRWFTCDLMEVYVRVRPRLIDGLMMQVIDVANVQVRKQGIGVYSDFLMFVEMNAKADAVFIENVHDRDHVTLYERRGYARHGDDASGCHLVKILKKS